MKTILSLITVASMVLGRVSLAQPDQVPDDWKPATSNQPGKQYPQVNSERRVRARIMAPQAQSVLLDIGGVKYPLTKGEDGAWLGESRPQDEGFHYYQIVVDGAQVPDPNSLFYYGAGRWGSGIEIPAGDQDFYALKNVPHGDLRETYYFSKNSNSIRRCFVYTPPGYDQDPGRRYPVLYLQHGTGEDETGWGNQGHANLILDNLLAEGKAKPFIIVMENGGGIRGPRRGGPPGRGPGGRFDFSGFERVLIDDLIPYIDSTYRTLADQPHRAMAGLSMGGMQTRMITLAHLDKFSQIGVFSGGSIALTNIADLANFKHRVKLVFVSYGSREVDPANRRPGSNRGPFRGDPKADIEALKEAGINAYYYVSPGTAHEWLSWRRSLYQFAQLVFQENPMQIAAALQAAEPTAAVRSAAETGTTAPAPAAAKASDISGIWKSEFESQIGDQKYTFIFKQDGMQLTGKAKSEVGDRKREADLKEGRVDGNTISFVEMLSFQDNEIRISYTGRLSPDGNQIKFTRAVGNFAKEEITARRAPTEPEATSSTAQIIRVKAGTSQPVKDADGNIWLADQGFEGGQTIERPDLQITNTKSPDLYRAERYSMDSFSWTVPNGKYVVKLHFAETFEGITGPGERVFSFNVQGHEFKDFDVWVKAGGPLKAYVETVPVEVSTGMIKITFTPKVENPQINAIEIIPEGAAETSAGNRAPAATTVAATTAVTTPATAANTSTANSVSVTPRIQIDAGRVIGRVSPTLYGLMTEEINFSYEGGIYGELLRNRSFKANAHFPQFWSAVGDATISLDTNQPLNNALNLSLRLDTTTASKASPAGIANAGFWGIPIRPATKYRASFYARGRDFAGPLTLSLESADGQTAFCSAAVSKIFGDWKKYEVTLKTGHVRPSKDNRFVIKVTTPGTVWFQNVSLFPPTYHHRPNGTRPDIMGLLAAMQPKFLRFPGGNYLEGNSIAERFNWKETIGDVAQRPGHRSPWGYWSTDGFGLLEFLEWCEDLHMQPVLALYAGYSLRGQHVEPGRDLEPFVHEALDEIEYVTGAATTTWGARRAKDGHPRPFKLTYVEVGNEDWFDRSGSYEGRFAQFYDAIKAKYPNLQVISTMGYEHPQQVVRGRVPDLVDEHYYRSREDMQAHALDYDQYSRAKPTKIFCGEWATRVGSPTPNMAGALGDAAWMTGMERNSDIVRISCYAPLFVNVSQLTGQGRSMQWSSDLIGYDALSSYGSPSYYAQKMFSTMHGDEILATDSRNIPTREWQPRARRGVPPPQPLREVFFDATRDSRNGVIYLKIVNEAGTPQPIQVQIKGCSKINARGEAVVLAARSLDDTNSLEQPEGTVPRTEAVEGITGDFTREFPPYSITVLKLKTR